MLSSESRAKREINPTCLISHAVNQQLRNRGTIPPHFRGERCIVLRRSWSIATVSFLTLIVAAYAHEILSLIGSYRRLSRGLWFAR